MAKKSISVTLEPATIENLKALANSEMRNISNMIDYIVAKYVLEHGDTSSEKNAQALRLAENVTITNFKDTEAALKNNVLVENEDVASIEKNTKNI